MNTKKRGFSHVTSSVVVAPMRWRTGNNKQ